MISIANSNTAWVTSGRSTTIAAITIAVFIAGCAAPQGMALRQAKHVYAEANNNPALRQSEQAAQYMKAADEALAEAQYNDDLINLFGVDVSPAEVDTYAYVSEQNVLAAMAAGKSQAIDDEIAKLELERDQALLARNEREAAEKAQREAEMLAEQERQRRDAELAAALESAKQRGAEIKEEGDQIKVTFRKVTFDPNKTEIKPEFQSTLEEIATALAARYPSATLKVQGHTDSVGPDTYNRQLSERRAVAVKTFLLSKGLPNERILSEGRGEAEPVAENTSAEGRALNRRVELLITSGETP